MAINYEPVGWDTTKHFNPTNMNHMDGGIKAACDKVDEHDSEIAEINSNLNSTNLQTLQSASSNGVISDALNVNLKNAYGVLNRPCVVTEELTTLNKPTDCAWGIRETLFLNENMVIVRITGVKTGGSQSAVWTNCYNFGSWTGWV